MLLLLGPNPHLFRSWKPSFAKIWLAKDLELLNSNEAEQKPFFSQKEDLTSEAKSSAFDPFVSQGNWDISCTSHDDYIPKDLHFYTAFKSDLHLLCPEHHCPFSSGDTTQPAVVSGEYINSYSQQDTHQVTISKYKKDFVHFNVFNFEAKAVALT